jgi:hypothetical protein
MDQSSSKQKQTIAATALVAGGIFSQPLLSDIATSTEDICEEHGITFCNAVVLGEVITSVLDEDTPPSLHQSNTPCIPNRVAKHDFLWKITSDLLADAFGVLKGSQGLASDHALEAMVELGLWEEPSQIGID